MQQLGGSVCMWGGGAHVCACSCVCAHVCVCSRVCVHAGAGGQSPCSWLMLGSCFCHRAQ